MKDLQGFISLFGEPPVLRATFKRVLLNGLLRVCFFGITARCAGDAFSNAPM